MRRLRLAVFNALTALSLVLCIAALADWITQNGKSHFISVAVWRTSGSVRVTRGFGPTTGHGVVIFTYYAVAQELTDPPPASHLEYATTPSVNWKLSDTFLGRAGFGTYVVRSAHGPRLSAVWLVRRGLEIPNWLLAAIFGVVPLIRLLKARSRRRRALKGFCRSCGYDLRASPDRCPECGTAGASPAPARRVQQVY